MITPKQKQHITGACLMLAIGAISLLVGVLMHEVYIYLPALILCVAGIFWGGSIGDTINK